VNYSASGWTSTTFYPYGLYSFIAKSTAVSGKMTRNETKRKETKQKRKETKQKRKETKQKRNKKKHKKGTKGINIFFFFSIIQVQL
jgi:uncharacterized membrane protein YcgQ (UPF0703/DUF1980 family)